MPKDNDMSSVTNPFGGLISISARLVSCGQLERLREICENKKSISTKKLSYELDKLENSLKDEGVRVRNMAKAIKHQ